MAYDFCSDAEKINQLKSDLTQTATDLTGLTDDIYTAISDLSSAWEGEAYDAFTAKANGFKGYLTRMSEILNNFATELDKILVVDETATTKIKDFLDCAALIIAGGADGTSEAAAAGRETNSDGTYVTEEGTYERGIDIPENTTVGEEFWGCAVVGDDLYTQAREMRTDLAGEQAALEQYREQHMSEILALPSPQREATLEYIDSEISKRSELISYIDGETHDAFLWGDGALFNSTSYGLTGNSVVGWTQQSTADAAVAAAQEINTQASQLSDIGAMEGYFMDLGFGVVGGTN